MDFNTKAESIYNGKIKEYFTEVTSSYYNGNYRAAIVVLYSVVVADIIYKLDELSKVYNEARAADILEAVRKRRDSNNKSADWEILLLDEIKKANDFFNTSTHINIDYLRNLRHLAAHPALDRDNELHLPNKDTVASCISNMLEDVLTKPPVFIKRATERIVTDIASKKNAFINDYENFKQYMISVYLSHMSPNMIKRVFKDIWELTFCLTDDDCNSNRNINYQCLSIMIERNATDILSDINNNKDSYSNVNMSLMNYICHFIAKYSDIYPRLGEPAKTLIQTSANTDEQIRIISHFLSDNIEEHLASLSYDNKYLQDFKYLERIVRNRYGGNISVMLSCYINFFAKCKSYDSANICFDNIVKPNIESLNRDHFIMLIEAINDNPQLHERGRARSDNTYIKKYADILLPKDFNYDAYLNFEYRTDENHDIGFTEFEIDNDELPF